VQELKRLIKDCLTENNGTSYCPFRVSGAALTASSIPTFIGGVISQIAHGRFDPMQFAMAVAAMLAGLTVLAAGVSLKAKTDTP
jgi:hypothetical protein